MHYARISERNYLLMESPVDSRWQRFGQWYAAQIRDAGITQKEAAERAGIHEVQMSRIVTGASGTKRETIPLLAKAVGIDAAEAYERAGYSDVSDGPDPDTQRKMIAFGNRLSEALYTVRKQQKDLAVALGVSETIVGKWISGDKSPMFGKIDDIARFVDCQVGWLYGDDHARGPGEDTVFTALGVEDDSRLSSRLQLIETKIDQLMDFSSGGRLNHRMMAMANAL